MGHGGQHVLDEAQVAVGAQEAVVLHPLVVEELGGVAGGRVAQDGHDGLAGAELLGQLDGHVDVAARGAAAEEAFLSHKATGHGEGLLVIDLVELVDDGEVHGFAEDVLADALDLVDVRGGHRLGVEVVVVDAADGVDAHDADVRGLLLEEAADAREGAAGAVRRR
jgi:hypothetical protein